MEYLNLSHLSALPISVARPRYDRTKLLPGLVHIGVGAFYRCHQADYTEDLLDAGLENRFVSGVNLRAPFIADKLARQDGLYTRSLVDNDTRQTRIIGGLRQVLDMTSNSSGVIFLLAAATTQVVTFTVTEKGYCHFPSTGALNFTHPDIARDLNTAVNPISLPGILCAALQARRDAGLAGLTMISCDNVQSNGKVLRGVVLAMAEKLAPGLANWIDQTCFFPSTMVDRIVPAFQETDAVQIRQSLGVQDAVPVTGEKFRQWVIEDNFGPGVPRWDKVGAEFSSDVLPYEHIKMRILNGAQSTLSHLGCILDIKTSRLAAADPMLRGFTRMMLETETLSTLHDLPGMAIKPYVETTFQRLDNKAIYHTCHQIATDGSQKIIQRLVNPLVDRLNRGQSSPLLATAIASWAAYLTCAAKPFGARWNAVDPLAETIRKMGEKTTSPNTLGQEILQLRAVFSDQLAADKIFSRDFLTAFEALLGEKPRAFLSDIMKRAG